MSVPCFTTSLADATLSLGEILRFISVITKKEVSADLFSKSELLCETLWELLVVYFDMLERPYKPAYVHVLLPRVLYELDVSQPVHFRDFEEPLDQKKWMFVFSRIIQYIQRVRNIGIDVQVYNKVVESKGAYMELLNAASQLKQKVAARRAETKAKQDSIEQLRSQLEKAMALDKAAEDEVSLLENRKVELNESISNRADHMASLANEEASLEAELQNLQKEAAQDVESLPEQIGMMKDRLQQLEVEMHTLFEGRSNLIEQSARHEQCVSLLSQLRGTIDEIHSLLKKSEDIRREEKHVLVERNTLMQKFDKSKCELDEVTHHLTDLQNNAVRKRLLIANKKKALQTKKKHDSKELDSIKNDMLQERKVLRQLQENLRVIEGQRDGVQREMKELDQRLPLVDKFNRLLNELYRQLDGMF